MSKKQAALKRWDILAEVIKSKNCQSDVNGSKRSFQSYNIVKISPIDDDTVAVDNNDADGEWKVVSYQDVSVKVRYLTPKLDLSQLVGFNNTGNVCVWPSEESLAVYCLNNRHLFKVCVIVSTVLQFAYYSHHIQFDVSSLFTNV